MAAMTMGPEPDVGRYIDTYKFDQQMEDRRQAFGGGTSLPLHSDGYEDKQKKLRDERRVEMMQQQEKPRIIQNVLMEQQRQLEKQKLEARQRSPPRPVQPAGPQVDYQANQQQARADDRRAYQDYMKAKEERYWAARGRPVTPAGGLDIGHYDRTLKETAQQKKDDYRQDLLRQQKEHMFLRARQENEIPVIDRTAQQAPNLASKPPPAPGHRPRDDPTRQTPIFWNEGQRARSPLSLDSEASRRSRPVGNSNIPLNEKDQKHRDDMHQMAMGRPAEVVKNQYYSSDNYESYQKDLQRKQSEEYRDFLQKKNQQVSNRGWDHNQSGILELRGDDATRNHQQELRSQLRNDYNSFINKEGDGQIRKRDMPQRAQSEPAPKQHKHINPIVQSMGRYEEIRNQLKEVRKDEFRKFQEQHKGEASRHPESQLTLPRIARDETPIVYKMSNYEENTGKLMLAQRRKDFQEFKQEKLKHLTPRSTTVKENVMPHVASSETPLVNHMGHYDEERRRYQLQRSKDQREYVAKKKEEHHSPYEHYVFPTVAIAEKPVVENMGSDVAQRQLHLREERKRDYERYQLQQRMSEPPRRHDYVDSSNGPYSGLFAGLGDHGNSKEVLKSQRKQEYNDHMEKFSDRGRSPMRNAGPPDQYSHGQADHYQQMLDEKRREEAHRRRYDDPEIQDRFAQNSRDQQRYNY